MQKKQHEKSCEIKGGELLLLKILPLSDHHSHFWAATFDFTTFFMLLFCMGRTFFFTVWLFLCRYILQKAKPK